QAGARLSLPHAPDYYSCECNQNISTSLPCIFTLLLFLWDVVSQGTSACSACSACAVRSSLSAVCTRKDTRIPAVYFHVALFTTPLLHAPYHNCCLCKPEDTSIRAVYFHVALIATVRCNQPGHVCPCCTFSTESCVLRENMSIPAVYSYVALVGCNRPGHVCRCCTHPTLFMYVYSEYIYPCRIYFDVALVTTVR
ncbi:unnamed protein product, partial [Ectocarpus sp. 4 AP-2014]